MKNVMGKVVMVLNMMNNKVAEVEMDVEILRDDMEMELYDETSAPTITDDYFEDLINIDENGEFVIINNEEEENGSGHDEKAPGIVEDVTKNVEFEVINEEYETRSPVLVDALEKVDIDEEMNNERQNGFEDNSVNSEEQEEVVV